MHRSDKIPAGSQYTPLTYFLLLFAMAGFTLAQPVYDLILSAPEFPVARQNTNADLWLLVIVLNVLAPISLALAGCALLKFYHIASKVYFAIVTFCFAVLFFAQLALARARPAAAGIILQTA